MQDINLTPAFCIQDQLVAESLTNFEKCFELEVPFRNSTARLSLRLRLGDGIAHRHGPHLCRKIWCVNDGGETKLVHGVRILSTVKPQTLNPHDQDHSLSEFA